MNVINDFDNNIVKKILTSADIFPVTYPIPPLKNDLLLRAINLEALPRTPVWMMRQAGRSDPEYLAYREKAGLPLFDLFRAPEHAIPISLLPQRIGVDAIIMFQDILTPLAPMGVEFHFKPGPVLEEPIRDPGQIEALTDYDPGDHLGFVGETLQGLQAELKGELPLLGFAGAPFTLAAFMIAGKSPPLGLETTLAFLKAHPEPFQNLMDKLTGITLAYLNYQIAKGAHAVQLFESVGDQIPRPIYEKYVQPSHQRIFAELDPKAPGILFVRESKYPELMLKSGAAVLSMGAGVSIRSILEQGGGRVAVQGNVDNRLLVEGSGEDVENAVRECLAEGGGRGHILNLSHGLLAETPFSNVVRFVEAAHSVSFS